MKSGAINMLLLRSKNPWPIVSTATAELRRRRFVESDGGLRRENCLEAKPHLKIDPSSVARHRVCLSEERRAEVANDGTEVCPVEDILNRHREGETVWLTAGRGIRYSGSVDSLTVWSNQHNLPPTATRGRTSAAFAESNRLAHAQVDEKGRRSLAEVTRDERFAGRRIGIESAVRRYENAGLAEVRRERGSFSKDGIAVCVPSGDNVEAWSCRRADQRIERDAPR